MCPAFEMRNVFYKNPDPILLKVYILFEEQQQWIWYMLTCEYVCETF